MQNLTNFDAMLKEKYAPVVIDALPKEVWWWDTFAHDGDSWEGRRVIEPIRLARNTGVGARPDAGTMPTAGNQTTADHIITPKYNYGSISVTGPTMAASKTSSGAFAKAMEFEMKYLIKDITSNLNRQFAATNLGILCLIKTVATSATQTIEYAGASSTPELGEPGTMYLKAGQTCLVGTTTATSGELALATGDAVTVSSVTDRDTVVFTSSFTSAEHDGIVLAGSAALADSAYNNEIEGWQAAMITSGAYQNITVTSYPDWMANVDTTSGTGRTLTWNLMQKQIDDIAVKGGECDLIVAHLTMRPEYLDMCLNDKRYLSVNKIDAGAKLNELAFATIPIKFVKDFPYNSLAFIDKSTWTYYPLGQPNWMNEDGSILSRSGDGMTALYRIYSNFGCSWPGANSWLKDISQTLATS